jgi:hypothetical protein
MKHLAEWTRRYTHKCGVSVKYAQHFNIFSQVWIKDGIRLSMKLETCEEYVGFSAVPCPSLNIPVTRYLNQDWKDVIHTEIHSVSPCVLCMFWILNSESWCKEYVYCASLAQQLPRKRRRCKTVDPTDVYSCLQGELVKRHLIYIISSTVTKNIQIYEFNVFYFLPTDYLKPIVDRTA